ncbi:MAG TPA: molybdate ABC transporter substrate-binding protein [Acidimicrobiales bacterium]|nr:molybdate ABC transporter substrate-binding protein [Acidimicrobiales bacterium]
MRRAVAAAAVLLLAASACSRGEAPRLTVFAAASLSRALRDDARTRYSFAGSQQLAAQVQAGAPADVIITADTTTMAALGPLVDRPVAVAENSLAIAVRPGNPKVVRGLADLAQAGLTLVLADPTVPAGRYAKQALDRAGVVVHPASLELDVESAVQKVALGQADAAVVYATDIVPGDPSLQGVAIPAAQNVAVLYQAATVRTTKHPKQAAAFLASLPARLRAVGFTAP